MSPNPFAPVPSIDAARRSLRVLARVCRSTAADQHAIFALNFNLSADLVLGSLPDADAELLRAEFCDLVRPGTAARKQLETDATSAFAAVHANAERPADRRDYSLAYSTS